MNEVLRVDYNALEGIARSLAAVAERFEGMQAHREGLEGVWGSSRVRREMDDFASNWHIHRARLTEAIKEVGGQCGDCVAAFREVDRVNTALPGAGP